jgi:hypothetical protein
MDRALPVDASPLPQGDALADEIRHSALLLGGALGLMSLLAAAMLLLTTRLGG